MDYLYLDLRTNHRIIKVIYLAAYINANNSNTVNKATSPDFIYR